MPPRISYFFSLAFALGGWLYVTAALCSGQSAPAEAPYVFEAGDTVELRFYYTPELNDRVQIRPDGNISVGLIGQVPAAGQTVSGLVALMEKQFAGILRKPSISVQVVNFANRRAFVGGEVAHPGIISLTGEQTALGAILEAGGLTKMAQSNNIMVVRRSASGLPETFHLALQRKHEPAIQAATFVLRPFDVVLVSESGIARANRAVDQYVFKFLPQQFAFGFTYLLNRLLVF